MCIICRYKPIVSRDLASRRAGNRALSGELGMYRECRVGRDEQFCVSGVLANNVLLMLGLGTRAIGEIA